MHAYMQAVVLHHANIIFIFNYYIISQSVGPIVDTNVYDYRRGAVI